MRTVSVPKLFCHVLLVFSFIVPIALAQKKMNRREVSRYISEAEKRMKDGDPSGAGGLYLRILEDFPERGDIRMEVARIYKAIDNWTSMANEYEIALETVDDEEDRAEAYEGMVMAYARTANYVKAVEVGREALKLNPQSAEVAIGLAMGLAKTGELVEAAKIAAKALELAPENAFAHNTLGEAALADGDFDKAEVSFQRALEIDPNTAQSHAGMADILFRREDYAGAESSATKALDLDDKLTRAFGVRGKARNALGKTAEAQGDLSMAVTVNPNDPDANLAFAQVYHIQENLNMATNYYKKTIELNPNLTEALEALGEIYVLQQKYNDLEQAMSQLITSKPDNSKAHYFLGLAQNNGQRADEALASFSEAARLDDSLADAHFEKGKILRTQKQTAAALEALGKAESLDATNADYLTELGIAYYEGQQLDPAMSRLEKAVGTPDYQNALGWAFYGLTLKDSQRFSEAVEYFQKTLVAFPTYGMAHWGLAWSAFGQIKSGCPCDGDDGLVALVVDHNSKAVENGAVDPGLQERADILAKGEKVR